MPAPASTARISAGHKTELIHVPTKPSGSQRTMRVTMNKTTPKPISWGPFCVMFANDDFATADFSNAFMA